MGETESILELRGLRRSFPLRRRAGAVRAVDGVDLELARGEIVALVGESGCGKTTLGKLVLRLERPDAGAILFEGRDVSAIAGAELKAYRRRVGMIFQDPYASMNPHFRVRDVLEEPLLIHRTGGGRGERLDLVRQALERVKVSPADEFLDRYPHMLSGGQRQRVATARTLMLSPGLVVADEPVSMIDLSTRAEILRMLKGVQSELGLSMLYITHDLSTARYFADRVCVMYLGAVMEVGPADELIERPAHPYTRALLAAVCEPVGGRANLAKELPIVGEVGSAAAMPTGCRFHPRCPLAAERCRVQEPPLRERAPGHRAACWLDGD